MQRIVREIESLAYSYQNYSVLFAKIHKTGAMASILASLPGLHCREKLGRVEALSQNDPPGRRNKNYHELIRLAA